MNMRIEKIIIILLIIHFSTVICAEKTFVREYTYYAEDYDSKITARTNALLRVKEELLEETSTLIITDINLNSWEKRIDDELSSGEDFKKNVTTISAGISTTTILDEKWTGETFWIKAEIVIDPEDIEKKLNIIFNNRKLLSDIVSLENIVSQADKEIARLKILLKDEKEELEIERLSKAYLLESDVLRSTELLYKGTLFTFEGDYESAKETFNEAIEIGQNLQLVYGLLAEMYMTPQLLHVNRQLGSGTFSGVNIEDVNQAIKYIKLAQKAGADEADVYGSLANAYWLLQKNWRAYYYQRKALKYETDSLGLCIEYNNSAVSSMHKGKIKKAKKLLYKAMGYDSLFSATYINFASIALSEKEYDRALKLNKKALGLSEFKFEKDAAYFGIVSYYQSMSYEALQLGDYQTASEFSYESFNYDTTFAMRDSIFSIIYSYLAISSYNLGYYEEAKYQCTEALSLPNPLIEGHCYALLGDIAGTLGNEEEMVQQYTISARLGYKPTQDYLNSHQIIWKE
jgi:tetratricopeptide (TPR) repeat protein